MTLQTATQTSLKLGISCY